MLGWLGHGRLGYENLLYVRACACVCLCVHMRVCVCVGEESVRLRLGVAVHMPMRSNSSMDELCICNSFGRNMKPIGLFQIGVNDNWPDFVSRSFSDSSSATSLASGQDKFGGHKGKNL